MRKEVELTGTVVKEEWEKTDHYCPSCGKQDVWRLLVNTPTTTPKHLCAADGCGARFQLSASIEKDDSDDATKRIEALKAPEEEAPKP